MNDFYVKIASHAIGLDHGKPYKRGEKSFYRPHRNYYDASPSDCEFWDDLVSAGYAKMVWRDRSGGAMYRLTRAGLDWLGKRLGMYIYNEVE